jgi:hypothetical protein
LKFRYSLPSLALKVQAFHDMEVSWDELRELAVPFLKSKLTQYPSHSLTSVFVLLRVHANETTTELTPTKEEVSDDSNPSSSSDLQPWRWQWWPVARPSVPQLSRGLHRSLSLSQKQQQPLSLRKRAAPFPLAVSLAPQSSSARNDY